MKGMNMKKIILVRYGEIILKGLNRPVFEDKLVKNIKRALFSLGKINVEKSQARIYIEPADEAGYDYNSAINRLTKVFGIVSASPAWKVNADFNEIKKCALEIVGDIVGKSRGDTFKVETKRGNKAFFMKSPEINAELGGYILENMPSLRVDVHNPSFVLYVEVREFAYIYSEIIPAYGGLPAGTNGKAALLLSGGIDSPVAGWMMAKRGVELEAVHFYSFPYTSERSKDKVIELVRILSAYCGRLILHIVPFAQIQLEILGKCPRDQATIIMRRIMMRIAERIARSSGAMALVTGESMGQVASQTMQSLAVTDAVVNMPVFRPLIGMDKNEVIETARKIGTFDTSILPYEDCCTVFTAKHPVTKPHPEKIEMSESKLDIESLSENAINNIETLIINPL